MIPQSYYHTSVTSDNIVTVIVTQLYGYIKHSGKLEK